MTPRLRAGGRDRRASYQLQLDQLEGRFYPGDTLGLLGWTLFGSSLDLLRPDPWVSPVALLDPSASRSEEASAGQGPASAPSRLRRGGPFHQRPDRSPDLL